MKKIYTLLLILIIANTVHAQVTVSPNPFEIDEEITITIDENSTATDCNGFNNPTKIYAHLGVGNDSDEYGIKVVGNFGEDDGVGEMTNNGNGIWSLSFTPLTYFNLTASEASNVIKMGMVFRNEDGSQEFKDNGCSNFIFDVGTFQINLSEPLAGATTIINSGDNLNIVASNIGGNANYTLKANGTVINTQSATSSYTYTVSNISANTSFELEATLDGTSISKSFSVLVDPGSNIEFMPTDYQNGITYLSDTEAVLTLYAAGKDFIYVAGSFNNWQPDASYALKRDPSKNKFWITLSNLTPGQIETYQYWVVDKTPIANSPKLVKTADPYSTLVLSPFDDPYIPSSSYPDIPAYPVGQEREVTVLQTGQTAYNWVVEDFTKPKKEDLVVYELLVRDFDANRNYQDVIDRMDYFKNLNINAIELMPVMEYEGNESWGYNTSFHMALDKFYGTEDKLRELIDVCHQNGIAVILDVALNHAFGRNPMVRMWMNDPDGDGWGEPSSDNPYLNQEATHSYSVGNDFDHSNIRTKNYVKRVVKHWIEDFKIDGFRWDLTKGFTQNCTANDEGCTNNYQQDRVDVLREYADYSWSLDPEHYVIFEHLGSDNEEQQWANYKVDEGKGIMMWGKMTNAYNQLTMGYNSDNNINRMGHESHGFNAKRLMGYAESHDEERLMYKNLAFGNQTNSSHNVRDLNTALSRMSALGAVTLTIPGPKMIWHFGELGMENSIFTCYNGTVNLEDDDIDGNCKLDTKPQPQWIENWIADNNRNKIYNDWARLNQLKIDEPVFEGDYSITSGNLTPRIDVFDANLPASQLKNVIVLANFDVVAQTVNTNFPTSGAWYDLMDETGNTTYSAATISIAPGQFRIFGNQASTLSTTEVALENSFSIYPNPVDSTFKINKDVTALEIYDITGKLVKTFKGDFNAAEAFDVTELNNSIYVLKIYSANGSTSTSKLIKM